MSKALCVATKCTTKDQFVESFYRFCDEHTFFVATLNQRPIGLETPFSINLADRSPMLRGLCVVLEAWATPANPFGRPGIKLGIKRLTTDSEDTFKRLAQRRGSAAPASAPAEPAAAAPAPAPPTKPAPPIPTAATSTASPSTLLGTGKSTKSFIPPIPGPGAAKPPTPTPPLAAAERSAPATIPNPLPQKPGAVPSSPGATLSAKLAAAGAAVKAASPPPPSPPPPSPPTPEPPPPAPAAIETAAPSAPVVIVVVEDPPTMPVSMPEKPVMPVVPSVVAQIEQRTPGSDIVLPANPLMNLSDESLEGFVDCTVYEETGNFFTSEIDPDEPLPEGDLADPPPPDFAPLRPTPQPSATMSAVLASVVPRVTHERAAEVPAPAFLTTAPEGATGVEVSIAAAGSAPSSTDTGHADAAQGAYSHDAGAAHVDPTQGAYPHGADATQAYGYAPNAYPPNGQPGYYGTAAPIDRVPAVMAPVARGGQKRTLAMAGGAAALSAIAVFAFVQSSSSAESDPAVAAAKQPKPEATKPTELASAAATTPSADPTAGKPTPPPSTDPTPATKPTPPTGTPDESGEEDDATPPPSGDGMPVVGTGPCRVDVTTTPAGTKVMFDDKEMGPSPITIQSTCDKHKVELIHQRYKQDVRFVAMSEGAPKKLDVTLIRPTHQLVIKTNPPGATISIQGRRAGTSPTTLAVMGFSGIDVSISRQGYETVTKRVYSKTPNDTLSISLKRYKW